MIDPRQPITVEVRLTPGPPVPTRLLADAVRALREIGHATTTTPQRKEQPACTSTPTAAA